MPLYEYTCDSCGNTIEVELSIEERDKYTGSKCSECFGTLRRTIGNNGGFRLGRGGSAGWAKDGYATTYGDGENFKARSKGMPEPYPSNIGKQR